MKRDEVKTNKSYSLLTVSSVQYSRIIMCFGASNAR